jgi:hypothetical protein
MVMDGIYTGIPRKMHRATADGIISGLAKDLRPNLKPDMCGVKPSATQFSAGVFGAGATPQGEGDGKKGVKGMALAHKNPGMSKARKNKIIASEKHQEMHNA